jgi:deoxycytidylate deaminase
MQVDKISKIFDTLSVVAEDVIPVSRAKIAACIYYKKRIVSIGTCQLKTHPFQTKFKKNEHACFLHAEVDAIKKAINRIGEEELKKCVLFVCRVKMDHDSKKDAYGIAKPCEGCQKCIDTYGIKEVYYTITTKNKNIVYEKMGV